MKILHRAAVLCLAAVLMLSMAACSSKTLKLGTGGTGGNYYAVGNVLSTLTEDNSDYTLTVKTTAGSAANLRLLNESFLDLAIVQSDTLLDAVKGEGAFEGKALTGFSAVASLYTEACQIIVPADSDIMNVQDLAGKRVSIGEEDSGVTQNAEQILKVCGLTTDMITVQRFSFADSAAAMKNGELDAFFCTAGAPTTAITELANEMDIRVISLDADVVSRMLDYYPCYSACAIPAGTYRGQEADVTTVGVKAVLVASEKLSESAVSEIIGLLFEHSTDFQYAVGIQPSLEEAVDGVPIGFHKGAAAYYADNNITVSTDNDSATTYGVNGAQDD